MKLAELHWPSSPQNCYIYVRAVYDTPYPQEDLLFVDEKAYSYNRYKLMSRWAWYVGKLRRRILFRQESHFKSIESLS